MPLQNDDADTNRANHGDRLHLHTCVPGQSSNLPKIAVVPKPFVKEESDILVRMIEDGLIKMREGHLEGRPCWRILPEELGVDSIDRGEVLHVLEQHGGLHHVPVVAARSLEKVSHVDYIC